MYERPAASMGLVHWPAPLYVTRLKLRACARARHVASAPSAASPYITPGHHARAQPGAAPRPQRSPLTSHTLSPAPTSAAAHRSCICAPSATFCLGGWQSGHTTAGDVHSHSWSLGAWRCAFCGQPNLAIGWTGQAAFPVGGLLSCTIMYIRLDATSASVVIAERSSGSSTSCTPQLSCASHSPALVALSAPPTTRLNRH